MLVLAMKLLRPKATMYFWTKTEHVNASFSYEAVEAQSDKVILN